MAEAFSEPQPTRKDAHDSSATSKTSAQSSKEKADGKKLRLL